MKTDKERKLEAKSRFYVVLLIVCLLGTVAVLAEETVGGCETACRLRYQAYYENCRMANKDNPNGLKACMEVVNGCIAKCTAACGDL